MIDLIPSIKILTPTELLDRETIERLKAFKESGVSRIHIIDVQGAKSNAPVALNLVKQITEVTGLKVSYSGGIKSRESLKNALSLGADQVICSTIASEQSNVFNYWAECFGSQCVVFGADLKEGKLLVKGRKQESAAKLEVLLKSLIAEGLKSVVICNVEAEEGGKFDAEVYRGITAAFPRLKVIARGGVNTIAEVNSLEEAGVKGAVFSLSESKLTPEEIYNYYKQGKDE